MVTRSPAATKPGLSPAALSAPRKNKPAAKSSMRESAICDMTEMCRGAKNRLRRPMRAGSPTCCFKSLTRSALVAFSAGPRLKRTVARRQNKNVTPRMGRFGLRSRMKEKFMLLSKAAREFSRRLLHHTLRTRPTTPPQIASSKPSASNCLMICQREAPSARRSAISFARVVPRASSMLARFKQAISNTAPAIAMSKVAINVIGLLSGGDVLRSKRDGACTCTSR